MSYLSTVPNLVEQYQFLPLCPTVPLSTSPVPNCLMSKISHRNLSEEKRCGSVCASVQQAVFFIELNTPLHFLRKAKRKTRLQQQHSTNLSCHLAILVSWTLHTPQSVHAMPADYECPDFIYKIPNFLKHSPLFLGWRKHFMGGLAQGGIHDCEAGPRARSDLKFRHSEINYGAFWDAFPAWQCMRTNPANRGC